VRGLRATSLRPRPHGVRDEVGTRAADQRKRPDGDQPLTHADQQVHAHERRQRDLQRRGIRERELERRRAGQSKESWGFLGYTTPEDALVSAIYSMQQGDTQAYFDSLAPEEQERMSERWQEQSETEISDKHQSDVAAIAGLQVLNRRSVTETEVLMDVYIDGPGRMETVSMQLVGEDWKFKGYVREDGQ